MSPQHTLQCQAHVVALEERIVNPVEEHTTNSPLSNFYIGAVQATSNTTLNNSSQTGILLINNKMETINLISAPSNLGELRVFLGIMRYYRQFIEDFAQLSELLVHLLRGVPIEWGPDQQ